jgi:hypothetical protein
MKIRRKSSQSSFFVNPSRTIKSADECLESSYFSVRRFGSGSFGKISPTFMKSWCSCQNNSNGLQRLVYGAYPEGYALYTLLWCRIFYSLNSFGYSTIPFTPFSPFSTNSITIQFSFGTSNGNSIPYLSACS